MALAINPINDVEIQRQKRNLTDSQKKNVELTKEGVVVNSLIKEKNVNMNDLYNTLVISENAAMPEKLYENKTTKDKSLLPLSFIATGVMAMIAGLSFLAKKSASVKSSLKFKPEQELDDIIRNININQEEIQSIYQIVHCPNKKTIHAGIGIITLGAMAFMGKMFMDGFKEVWVKKREADIQKNLQENLIAVETQSFSGKIQIVRSMLADKAREFNEYLHLKHETPPVFKNFNNNLKFMGKEKQPDEKSDNLKYFALGALTLGTIAGLAFLSIKTLTKGKKEIEKYIEMKKDIIKKIVDNSTEETKESAKTVLKKTLQSIDADSKYIKQELSRLNWNESEKSNFINNVIYSIQKSTTEAPLAVGGSGTPKPAFNSYISDYKAFFYNYLLDSDNPQFKMLFWGVTGLSAFTYGGKVLGEAVKDIQVKKMNAQTELELQQRLVATELRNFKAKKDAAIDPLCEEFYVQLKNGKSKEELRVIAENILFEVKNGPPFVYS